MVWPVNAVAPSRTGGKLATAVSTCCDHGVESITASTGRLPAFRQSPAGPVASFLHTPSPTKKVHSYRGNDGDIFIEV
jgi:hypothetical protein